MRLLTNPIALAIVSVALIFASFRVGRHFGSPTTVVQTDTVHVDREITRRDTIRIVQPREVKVFRTVTETRVDTIRVPVNLSPVGVIGANPITRGKGNKLTLTSFDLGRQAFTQQTYSVPPRRWGLGLFAVSSVGDQNSIGVELRIRYERIELSPFWGVSVAPGEDPTVTWSVKGTYKLF